MRFLILIILFLLLSFNVYANLIITEILANPIQNDTYNEYIEIYNSEDFPISIENLTLCNKSIKPGYVNKQDSRIYNNSSLYIDPRSYALITDGGSGTEVYTNFNTQGTALHTNVSSLCGSPSLPNNGKEVSLYQNGIKIDNVTYPDTIPGLSWGLVNGIWMHSSTTPGYLNYIPNNLSDEQNASNVTQSQTPNETTNNTIYTQNNETATIDDSCDWQVLILLNKTIFYNASEAKWKIAITKNKGYRANILFKRFVSDENGNIIKRYEDLNLNITNKRNFAYSPKLKPGSYIINAEIKADCEDINSSNNIASTPIQIKEKEEDGEEEMTINEDTETIQLKEIQIENPTIENSTETNLNSSLGSITGRTVYNKEPLANKKAIYILVASIVVLVVYFIYKRIEADE